MSFWKKLFGGSPAPAAQPKPAAPEPPKPAAPEPPKPVKNTRMNNEEITQQFGPEALPQPGEKWITATKSLEEAASAFIEAAQNLPETPMEEIEKTRRHMCMMYREDLSMIHYPDTSQLRTNLVAELPKWMALRDFKWFVVAILGNWSARVHCLVIEQSWASSMNPTGKVRKMFEIYKS